MDKVREGRAFQLFVTLSLGLGPKSTQVTISPPPSAQMQLHRRSRVTLSSVLFLDRDIIGSFSPVHVIL